MKTCSKCRCKSVQKISGVIRSYQCPSCGWIEIHRKDLVPRRPTRIANIALVVLVCGCLIVPLLLPNTLIGSRLPSALPKVVGGVSAPAPQTLPRSSSPLPEVIKNLPLQQAEPLQVVANSDSRHYHLPGMEHYSNVASYHRVIFPSEEAARLAGYHRASR